MSERANNVPYHDLGKIDPAFAGWKIHGGQLWLPNGYSYGPGYIYAIPIRMQQLSEYERLLSTPEQWQLL